MANRNHGLSEKKTELVQLLMADCKTTETIEQILEAETDEHLGYEENSILS